MQLYESPCIVLRARPFQENARLLTCLMPDRGVLRGIARGGLRSGSRRTGNFEPLTCGIMHYSCKETSELATLRKCDPAPPYVYLTGSYEKICFASHFAGLLERVPAAGEDYSALYTLLLESLQAVCAASGLRQLPLIQLRFELKWLQMLGMSPQWERCVQCEAAIFTSREEGPARREGVRLGGAHQFDAGAGGVRCPDCVAVLQALRCPLPADALEFLRAWRGGADAVRPTRGALLALREAMALHIIYQLEYEPPSLRMLPPLDSL